MRNIVECKEFITGKSSFDFDESRGSSSSIENLYPKLDITLEFKGRSVREHRLATSTAGHPVYVHLVSHRSEGTFFDTVYMLAFGRFATMSKSATKITAC